MKSFFCAAVIAGAFGLASPTIAQDLEFLLVNETDVDITGFYVSSTESDYWEENLLEGDYIPSGYEVDVIIADGLEICDYDIRTEFEDGDVYEDFDLDLCELGEYIFE